MACWVRGVQAAAMMISRMVIMKKPCRNSKNMWAFGFECCKEKGDCKGVMMTTSAQTEDLVIQVAECFNPWDLTLEQPACGVFIYIH